MVGFDDVAIDVQPEWLFVEAVGDGVLHEVFFDRGASFFIVYRA